MTTLNTLPYVPDPDDSLEDAWPGWTGNDPGPSAFPTTDPDRTDCVFLFKPLQDLVLGLMAGAVGTKTLRRAYNCLAGLNVGDPVVVSAANTVSLALATSAIKVFGFVRAKPTSTTCYLDWFRYVSGLSGLTAGSDVYLNLL